MTTSEFSDMFDTLLNSYASQAVFGEEASKNEVVLDEYEKSVLLTQAQDIIVKAYFERNNESQGNGFDDTIRRQVDFSSLIRVAELKPSDSENTFDDRGIIFDMPRRSGISTDTTYNENSKTYTTTTVAQEVQWTNTDVLFILNERIKYDGKTYVVVPLNYKEYDREMSKPYAQPLKKQAWRLFQNTAAGFDVQSELIPLWNIGIEKGSINNGNADDSEFIYKIRYVQRPRPIVLVDLPNDLSIDGVSTKSNCTLNPIVHMDILNKAVEIAISTRGRVAGINNRQEK